MVWRIRCRLYVAFAAVVAVVALIFLGCVRSHGMCQKKAQKHRKEPRAREVRVGHGFGAKATIPEEAISGGTGVMYAFASSGQSPRREKEQGRHGSPHHKPTNAQTRTGPQTEQPTIPHGQVLYVRGVRLMWHGILLLTSWSSLSDVRVTDFSKYC